ncbi:hypothetical protein BS78_10G053700 [Paspalum vaginatum]|nr:hypothetical protein BS78_10G053700 [Paspalum vaginatum]
MPALGGFPDTSAARRVAGVACALAGGHGVSRAGGTKGTGVGDSHNILLPLPPHQGPAPAFPPERRSGSDSASGGIFRLQRVNLSPRAEWIEEGAEGPGRTGYHHRRQRRRRRLATRCGRDDGEAALLLRRIRRGQRAVGGGRRGTPNNSAAASNRRR